MQRVLLVIAVVSFIAPACSAQDATELLNRRRLEAGEIHVIAQRHGRL